MSRILIEIILSHNTYKEKLGIYTHTKSVQHRHARQDCFRIYYNISIKNLLFVKIDELNIESKI